VPLSALAAAYDHLLLDLDGCVWLGDQLIEGADDAVAALRHGGKRVAFVTNDARHSGEEFVRKLWSLGIQASLEEIVTAGGALQHFLAERHSGANAVVIGSTAIHRHVRDAGLRIVNGTDFAPRASVVVVAGHDAFDYAELRDATQAARNGAHLVGACRDATYPQPDGPWPGTGAILAAVEVAGAVTAETVGKPMPQLYFSALDRLGPGRPLVIGDRVEADLAGARAAGIDGAIVFSGASNAADVAAAGDPPPVAVGRTLAELILA
jgi:HAD superfamily hydrolase (TIGR01450 family)